MQELVSKKDQATLRTDPNKFEPQLDFVPAPALAAAFERSGVYKDTRARLDTPFDKSKSHPGALMKSKFGVAGWDAVKALMWRERILLLRDRQGQIYRYVQMAVLAFVFCTLFVRGRTVTSDSVRVRFSWLRYLPVAVAMACSTH